MPRAQIAAFSNRKGIAWGTLADSGKPPKG